MNMQILCGEFEVVTHTTQSGFKSVRTFDRSGLELYTIYLSATGELVKSVVHSYDCDGRETGNVAFDQTGNLERASEYVYDESGLEKQTIEYDSYGEQIRRTEYVRDCDNRVVKEMHFNKDNLQKGYGVAVFDDSGDYIQTVYFDMNDKQINSPAC